MRFLYSCFVAALVALTSPAALATTVIEIDLDQMTSSSDLVLHGRVRDSRVESVAGNERHLRTVVEIDVIEMLKGERTRKSVRLELPGGRLGKWAMLIPGMPTFTTGEELVLFLESLPKTQTRPEGFAITGLSQGKFAVTVGEGGVQQVRRNLDGLNFYRKPGADPLVEKNGPVRAHAHPAPMAAMPQTLLGLLGEVRTLVARGAR
ncbi:MAG: hypothetical protein IV100_14680 [Myxococcales bacterium]|nr:hypothetical protein [Myxococcales bacterium]